MEFKDSRDYLTKINQSFHWILAGPLLFFAYLFFTRSKSNWEGVLLNKEYNDLLLFILLPTLILASIWTFKNFRTSKKDIIPATPLTQKLDLFYKAFIQFQIYFSLYGLLSLTGLYISGKLIFLGYYIFILFTASMHNPSLSMIERSLRLNEEEREILRKEKPIQKGK